MILRSQVPASGTPLNALVERLYKHRARFLLSVSEMTSLLLGFLCLLATAAGQHLPVDAQPVGLSTNWQQDAFFRRQRASLMDSKQALIAMINELRETIFRQQLLLSQYFRDQAAQPVQHPISV
ncbi:expressed conserved protein [Echinococcus multilocularis]|uniref:Expressed conserved protein n=1 Tax=Echinococcus multilocularis TaxID=6211 RepID=A0A068Y3D4_ECHMU|nr:expressed conserved protein [Echinococcus multilocularis]